MLTYLGIFYIKKLNSVKKNESVIRLFAIAKLLMPAFVKIHRDILGSRKGVYLAIRPIYKNVGEPVFGEIIGELPCEKVEEKKKFAIEKINRMKTNGEYCSFQSENEEQKQFGGGIRATRYFISPSGFPPHLDQKFAIKVALMAEELRVKDFHEIMDLSLLNVNVSRRKNGELPIPLSKF